MHYAIWYGIGAVLTLTHRLVTIHPWSTVDKWTRRGQYIALPATMLLWPLAFLMWIVAHVVFRQAIIRWAARHLKEAQ